MATIDLSRSATDYRKHYKSVRAQQGRVFIDDDHNENERIHGEDLRSEIVEIVGPTGAPGDGFQISNPRLTGGKIDFDLAAGSLYVGGSRLKLDAPTTFQLQPDWLEIFGSASLNAPAASRDDLVYVETYQVAVAAVEDSERFEVGLGGPDTSVTIQQVQRIHILPGFSGADCGSGWSSLGASFKSQKRGTLNAENELVPDTILTVGFANNGAAIDLCSPPVAGGYLGAENQAIRVELVDATHFTWGFDNASPLYRVKLDAVAGVLTQVTMVTEPKDQPHWPLAGQIVEFLPWSTVLPNNEKTAELSGFLARVTASYNPDLKQFSVDPVPATFGIDWQQRSDHGTLETPNPDIFFYMRVWNRGGDTASPLAIPFTTGTPADLLGTGLQVTFTGSDHPFDDFWIIAARPDSPDLVVPWMLQNGAARDGYRRFYAPLGVIEWTLPAGGVVTGKIVDDCRLPFLPLTKIRGCCTVTVGNGITSFGNFTSIQKAINSLPATGGEVCILAGTYAENFTIHLKHHITIHGCGEKTILEPGPNGRTLPVITIEDSQFITIKDLTIASPTSLPVLIASSLVKILRGGACDHIVLRALHFEARDTSAIACFYATRVYIVENSIHMNQLAGTLAGGSFAGMAPAIFLFGEEVEIARNHIFADAAKSLTASLGGIQLFGICEGVRIEHNRIEGGNGNGITLGAVFWIESSADPVTGVGTGIGLGTGSGIYIDPNGCVHVGGETPPNDPTGKPMVPVAWGLFFDIRILNNDILGMGSSGIGSPDLPSGTIGLPIVEIIEITHNRISGCVLLDRSDAIKKLNKALPGRGGIALEMAGYAIIRDNWIAVNGPSFIPSVCGIWFGFGSGIIVERNEVLDNGPRILTQQQFEAGPRAGIRVELALPAVSLDLVNKVGTIEVEFPALRVHDNIVVAPSGAAFTALAFGPVSISSNEFTSGVPDPISIFSRWPQDKFRALFGGTSVFLLNLGSLSETTSASIDYKTVGLHSAGIAGSYSYSSKEVEFISGDILFNDNRVLLNFPDSDKTPLISSVTLFCLADLSIEGNQLTARTGKHLLVTNIFAIAASVRLEGNRCQDRFDLGYSGVSIGIMNATVNNQGSRCFYATGNAQLLVKTGNRSWFDLLSKGACEKLGHALDTHYGAAGYATGH